MKKRLFSLIIALVLLVGVYGQAYAAIPGYSQPAKPIKVYLHSREVKLSLPILGDNKNNRTLYPFRELMELVGADVSWNQENKHAIAELDGVVIEFPQGKDYFYKNGQKIKMDTTTRDDPAVQRTYISIRYAMEAFGFDVQWISCLNHNEIRISKLGPFSMVSDEDFAGKYYNYDYTSDWYYEIDKENKVLLFKDSYEKAVFSNYKLSEKLNPNINKQVYNLMKTLTGDEGATIAMYNYVSDPRVIISYGGDMYTLHGGVSYFYYVFYEKEYYEGKKDWKYNKFSDEVFADLNINRLWGHPERFDISDAIYEKKLRDSLISLFGEKTGTDIYKYTFEKYIQLRYLEGHSYMGQRDMKVFDNVQVDYSTGQGSTMYFSFSFVK